MTINIQKPIVWINDCNCVVDESLLTEAVLWLSNSPMQSVKHIYKHGEYAGVTVNGKKVHIHRLLMEYEIKGKLSRRLYVHHLDGNKMNDTLSNLSIMIGTAHTSHHTKGLKRNEQQRQNISEANRRRKGIKMAKRVHIPLNELSEKLKNGQSINSIAKEYHCNWTTVKARIVENPELLEVIDNEQ